MPLKPELSEAHSRLAVGILRRIFVREELQDLWRHFGDLPTETGLGKASLTEIITQSMGISRDAVRAESTAQKAEWCVELLANVRDDPFSFPTEGAKTTARFRAGGNGLAATALRLGMLFTQN